MSSDYLSTTQSAGAAPSIGSLQLDPGGAAAAARSVNSFRGEVNLPIPLVEARGGAGASYKVQIMYSGCRRDMIATTNMYGPTNELGLGWTLCKEYIYVRSGTPGSGTDETYYLVSGGARSELLKTGSRSYVTNDAKAWKVDHDPDNEEWTVIHEDGSKYRYGGKKQEGGALRYAVAWGNWQGASVASSGKSHVSAWNLVAITDTWDNTISFRYDCDNAQIGRSAAVFTQACRLATIIDAQNRTIQFNYADKVNDGDVVEVEFPHSSNSDAYQPYQDAYETKYLESVHLSEADGSLFFEILVESTPYCFTEQSAPDRYKRCIDRIQTRYPDGTLAPSLEFTYVPAGKAGAGSLRTIRYPRGSLVTYDYKELRLSEAQTKVVVSDVNSVLDLPDFTGDDAGDESGVMVRSQWEDYDFETEGDSDEQSAEGEEQPYARKLLRVTWDPDESENDASSGNKSDSSAELTGFTGPTRIWHGLNYTVVTCQNVDDQTVDVTILTWVGCWRAVRYNDLPCSADSGDVRVAASSEFFLLYTLNGKKSNDARIFYQNPFNVTDWRVKGVGLSVATAAANDTAIALVDTESHQGRVYEMNNGLPVSVFDFTAKDSDYALGAASACFTIAGHDGESTLAIWTLYRTSRNTWNKSGARSFSDILWSDSLVDSFWGVGNGFAAASLLSNNPDQATYRVGVLDWTTSLSSPRWRVLGTFDFPESEENLPFAFCTVRDSVIVNNEHCWRYDPEGGFDQEVDIVSIPSSNPIEDAPVARFSCAADVATAAVNKGSFAENRQCVYDPYDGAWRSIRTLPNTSVDAEYGPAAPTVQGDYMTVGTALYYRGADSDWSQVSGAQIARSADLNTVHNSAPYFIASEDSKNQNTTLALLQSGSVARSLTLSGAVFKSHDIGGPGTNLASGPVLLTFPAGKTLDAPGALTCYRISNPQFDSSNNFARVVVVRKVTYDNNEHETSTLLDYNEQSSGQSTIALGATYDMAAEVAQFPKAVSVAKGTGDYSDMDGGSVVRYYANGAAPGNKGVFYPPSSAYSNMPNYYSVISGAPIYEETYDAEDNPLQTSFKYTMVKTFANDTRKSCRPENPRSLTLSNGTYLATAKGSDYAFELDQGRLPSGMLQVIVSAGLEMSSSATVMVIERNVKWLLLDDDNDLACTVLQKDADAFSIYGMLRSTYDRSYNKHGQVTDSVTSNVKADGTTETYHSEITYFSDVYPEIAAERNLIGHKMQVTKWQQSAGSSEKTYLDSVVTTWLAWDQDSESGEYLPAGKPRLNTQVRIATHGQYSWNGPEDGQKTPDYSKYWDSQEPVPNWRVESVALRRARDCQTSETLNARGIHSSVVYGYLDGAEGRTPRYPIARAMNASFSRDEAMFYGCESYEKNPGWKFLNRKEFAPYTGDAWCGSQCLAVPSEDSLTLQLTPESPRQYLYRCWVKTGSTFGPFGSALITFTDAEGNPLGDTLRIEGVTDGWEMMTGCVDLSEKSGATQLTIAIANRSETGALLVDALQFFPVPGAISCSFFDSSQWTPMASIDTNGLTHRTALDGCYRPVIGSAPGDSVRIQSAYCWRDNNSTGAYDAGDPSSQLAVGSLTEGSLITFMPDTWQEQVEVKDPTQWYVDDGRLCYQGTTQAALTLAETEEQSHYGALWSLSLPNEREKDVVFSLGSIKISLDPDFLWSLSGAGLKKASVQAEFSGALHCCGLVHDKNTFFFFVNGKLLFSELLSQAASGPAVVTVSEPGVCFRHLALSIAPLVSRSFANSADRPWQRHALIGQQAIISQDIRDPLGRQAVRSKNAQLGTGDGPALLRYRESFAKMHWDTGILSGEIATYWPDDEGFSMIRTRYEDSPLGRTLESANAGKDYAIGSGRTEQLAYALLTAGKAASETSLAGGQFAVVTTRNPDGLGDVKITDKLNRDVAIAHILADGSLLWDRGVFDDRGDLSVWETPEALASGESDYDVRYTHSYRHWITLKQTPDGNEIRTIYNPLGGVRFQQDSQGAKDGWYRFWTYDVLGRPFAEGVVYGTWDESTLQTLADNLEGFSGQPDQAGPSNSKIKYLRSLSYDGYGEQSVAVGKAVAIQANDPAGTGKDYFEQYEYNEISILSAVTSQLMEVDSAPYKIQYATNAAGFVDTIDYGNGLTVQYGYDQLSRVTQVGSPEEPDMFGKYEYTESNQLKQTTMGPNDIAVTLPYAYDTQSRLTQIGDISQGPFQRNLYYDKRANGKTGYYGGPRASVVDQWNENFGQQKSGSASAQRNAFEIHYDYRYQITAAEATNSDWSFGEAQTTEYDANGNQLAGSLGEAAFEYTFKYNQPLSIKSAELGSGKFEYSANGCQVYSPINQLRFSYDAFKRPESIDLSAAGNGSVAFRYGRQSDRRILKTHVNAQSAETLTRYVRGANQTITREKAGDADVSYVYGPTGIVALVVDGSKYWIIQDDLGSSRVMLDSEGKITAGFNYTPLGGEASSYGSNPSLLRYRFTNQEFDPETGLYNFHLRIYDPVQGRFYQQDPAGQYASPYVYAGNNAFNLVDPNGAVSWWSWDAFGAAICDIASITVGIAIDAVSAGTLEAVGATLIGGGFQGLAYSVEAGITGEFDWTDHTIQYGIGAAVGLVTFGVGELAGAAGNFAAGQAANAGWSIGKQAALRVATREAITISVGGLVVASASGVDNVLEGGGFFDDFGENYGVAVLEGGVTLFIGAGLNRLSEGAGSSKLIRSVDSHFGLTGSRTGLIGSIIGQTALCGGLAATIQFSMNAFLGDDLGDQVGEAFAWGAAEGLADASRERLQRKRKFKNVRQFAAEAWSDTLNAYVAFRDSVKLDTHEPLLIANKEGKLAVAWSKKDSLVSNEVMLQKTSYEIRFGGLSTHVSRLNEIK